MGKKITIVVIIMVLLCGGLGAFYWLAWRVEPVAAEHIVEFGEAVSEEITDYVSGYPFSLKFAHLDLSEVNTEKVGTYQATVTHGFETYTYDICIEDTTAPTLVPKSANYLAVKEVYRPEDLLERASDLSGDVTLIFTDKSDKTYEEFSRAARTNAEVTIMGEDIYGNQATCTVAVVVDTPPVIKGLEDWYVATGEDCDFLEGVTARDDVDGDLTDQLESDTSKMNFNRTGTYAIPVSVTDQYGLTTEEKITVTICSPDNLQDMVNTGKLNRKKNNIVGAYNLYDGGTTKGEMEDVLAHYDPAIVCVLKGRTRGNGFVVKVTDDKLYLFTNHHVVGEDEQVNVEFYDQSVVTADVLAVGKESKGEYDMALLSVDRKDLSKEMEDNLMTVHIDESTVEYYRKKKTSAQLGISVHEDSLKLKKAEVQTGKLVSVAIEADSVPNAGAATEFSIRTNDGMSGAAVLDERGNLVSMVSFGITEKKGKNKDRGFGVPLKRMLEFYEETTGEKLNYK